MQHTLKRFIFMSIFILLSLSVKTSFAQLSETAPVSIGKDQTAFGYGAKAFNGVSVSDDGRYYTFVTRDALNGTIEPIEQDAVYLKDMETGDVTLISKHWDGTPWRGTYPSITGDGKYIVFSSDNLKLNETDPNQNCIYRYDRPADTLQALRCSQSDIQVTTSNSVSADGNLVVHTKYEGSPPTAQLVLFNVSTGTDTLIAHRWDDPTVPVYASYSEISADGSQIVFRSTNEGLVENEPPKFSSALYHYDVLNKKTTWINQTVAPEYSDVDPFSISLSRSGRFVTWAASDQGNPDEMYVFRHDIQTGETRIVTSVNYQTADQLITGTHGFTDVSNDGKFVAFASASINLVPGKTNGKTDRNNEDVFVHNMETGENIRLSVNKNGDQAPWVNYPASIQGLAMNSAGTHVVYQSNLKDLVSGITYPRYGEENHFHRSIVDWTRPTVIRTSLTNVPSGEGFNSFTVTFSEPMTREENPDSMLLMTGANNPLNYVLVSAGLDGVINTLGCNDTVASPIQGDDVLITTDAAVYDNSNYTTTININNGAALTDGMYRFFACGATDAKPFAPRALHDGVGNAMREYQTTFFVGPLPPEPTPQPDPIYPIDPFMELPSTGFPVKYVQP